MFQFVRNLSVAKKVIFIVTLGYSLLSAYFIIWSYHSYLADSENETLLRLQGIANSLSVQVNANEHEFLVNKYSNKDAILKSDQDSIYYKLHLLLKKNKDANMLKTPIYTMVLDSNTNQFLFIVSSSDNPYFKHPYQSFPKILKEQYKSGGKIKRYVDENGEWLSAFAPIKNDSGQVVALVQIDQQFDEFLMKAGKTAWENMFISLFVFLIVLLILIRLLKIILEKEEKDRRVIEESYRTNASISRQLEQSLMQLKEIDKLRKEMIANISHDLRTPLSTISGFIETLYLKRKEIGSEDSERYLRIVLKESGRLNKLITELFELTKLEANQIKLKIVPFSIAELIQDVCQKYHILCQQKNITLNTNLSNNIPYVLADIELIDRVLQNLIDNAIKYNFTNGKIDVALNSVNDLIEIKITNSGPGIDKEEIAQIFDRYYRIANSNSAENSTGLGLAIVNKIIELHGATINVVSELNKQTSFFFNLPVYKQIVT